MIHFLLLVLYCFPSDEYEVSSLCVKLFIVLICHTENVVFQWFFIENCYLCFIIVLNFINMNIPRVEALHAVVVWFCVTICTIQFNLHLFCFFFISKIIYWYLTKSKGWLSSIAHKLVIRAFFQIVNLSQINNYSTR